MRSAAVVLNQMVCSKSSKEANEMYVVLVGSPLSTAKLAQK